MLRWLLAFLVLSGMLPALGAAEPTYWQDIRPLLRKNCTVCHNPRQLAEPEVSGGLTLDTYPAVLRWARKKLALVQPGKSGDSLLYQVLVADDPDKRMPLGAKPLSAEQIALMRRWIDTGAKEGTPPAEAPVEVTRPRRRKLEVTLTAAGKTAPTLHLRVGPLSPITAVAFHPAGRLLAVGSYGQVTVWDLHEVRPATVLTNVLGAVNDLRFSPDGQLLAVAGGQASARGDLRLFTVSDWKLRASLSGHEDVVNSVSFSKDGQKLLSGSFDRTARLWEVASSKLERVLTHHSDFVTAVGFAPDGRHLFTGSKDRSVRLVELSGAGKFTFSDRQEDVLSLAVHPGGASVVVTGLEPDLTWWNTQTGEKIRAAAGHRGAVHELTFSSDGKLLASAGADGTIKLWDGTTGTLARSAVVGSPTYAVALRSDGGLVAAGSFDGLVRLFDASLTPCLTLLALPPDGGRTAWLALTSAGQVDGNPELLQQIRWQQAGKPLPPEATKTLIDPAAVRRALGSSR